MVNYIIRLDDACPTMNSQKWERMEKLLDKYCVKPLIGIIPDNHDSSFNWPRDNQFWEKARKWAEKGYTIALHGLHHKFQPSQKRKCFHLTHNMNSEFAGVSLDKQRKMVAYGLSILREKGVPANSFFAPAHTFDKNTVKALIERKEILFISDGYALKPYKKVVEGGEMTFIPSICDGPFDMPISGIYTFVFHPSVMTDNAFSRLEAFLEKNSNNIIAAEQALKKVKCGQGIVGHMLEIGVWIFRGIRDKKTHMLTAMGYRKN